MRNKPIDLQVVKSSQSEHSSKCVTTRYHTEHPRNCITMP